MITTNGISFTGADAPKGDKNLENWDLAVTTLRKSNYVKMYDFRGDQAVIVYHEPYGEIFQNVYQIVSIFTSEENADEKFGYRTIIKTKGDQARIITLDENLKVINQTENKDGINYY